MGLYFAAGRTKLNNADWTITVNSGGGNLTSGIYRFSLAARNRLGYNEPIYSDPINVSNGDSITISVNNSALKNGEDWRSYLISVKGDDGIYRILTSLQSIIPSDPKTRFAFPLSVTIKKDEELKPGRIVETLPTSAFNKMAVRYAGYVYLYDAFDLTSAESPPNILLGPDDKRWKYTGTLEYNINDVYGANGALQNALFAQNYQSMDTVKYTPDGTESEEVIYWIDNGNGEVTPAGSNILINVLINDIDKSDLFRDHLILEPLGFVNKSTGQLRTDNGTTTFTQINREIRFGDEPLYLEDDLQPNEYYAIKLSLKLDADDVYSYGIAGLPIQPYLHFSVNISSYNPAAKLYGESVIYNKGGLRRVYPEGDLTMIADTGTGIIKGYDVSLRPAQVFSNLLPNTADQRVVINRMGDCFIETQTKIREDAELRAVVSTVSGESHASTTFATSVLNGNTGLQVTVKYPVSNGIATIRSSLNDVIASSNHIAKFTIDSVYLYVEALIGSTTEIRKFGPYIPTPNSESDNFQISSWSNGTPVTSIPNTYFGLFDPNIQGSTGNFIAGNLPAGTYKSYATFYYDGNQVTNIRHKGMLNGVNIIREQAEGNIIDILDDYGYYRGVYTLDELKSLDDTKYATGTEFKFKEADGNIYPVVLERGNNSTPDDFSVILANSGTAKFINRGVPTGPAGGYLSGEYPNPSLVNRNIVETTYKAGRTTINMDKTGIIKSITYDDLGDLSGEYTNPSITLDAYGNIVSIASGVGGNKSSARMFPKFSGTVYTVCGWVIFKVYYTTSYPSLSFEYQFDDEEPVEIPFSDSTASVEKTYCNWIRTTVDALRSLKFRVKRTKVDPNAYLRIKEIHISGIDYAPDAPSWASKQPGIQNDPRLPWSISFAVDGYYIVPDISNLAVNSSTQYTINVLVHSLQSIRIIENQLPFKRPPEAFEAYKSKIVLVSEGITNNEIACFTNGGDNEDILDPSSPASGWFYIPNGRWEENIEYHQNVYEVWGIFSIIKLKDTSNVKTGILKMEIGPWTFYPDDIEKLVKSRRAIIKNFRRLYSNINGVLDTYLEPDLNNMEPYEMAYIIYRIPYLPPDSSIVLKPNTGHFLYPEAYNNFNLQISSSGDILYTNKLDPKDGTINLNTLSYTNPYSINTLITSKNISEVLQSTHDAWHRDDPYGTIPRPKVFFYYRLYSTNNKANLLIRINGVNFVNNSGGDGKWQFVLTDCHVGNNTFEAYFTNAIDPTNPSIRNYAEIKCLSIGGIVPEGFNSGSGPDLASTRKFIYQPWNVADTGRYKADYHPGQNVSGVYTETICQHMYLNVHVEDIPILEENFNTTPFKFWAKSDCASRHGLIYGVNEKLNSMVTPSGGSSPWKEYSLNLRPGLNYVYIGYSKLDTAENAANSDAVYFYDFRLGDQPLTTYPYQTPNYDSIGDPHNFELTNIVGPSGSTIVTVSKLGGIPLGNVALYRIKVYAPYVHNEVQILSTPTTLDPILPANVGALRLKNNKWITKIGANTPSVLTTTDYFLDQLFRSDPEITGLQPSEISISNADRHDFTGPFLIHYDYTANNPNADFKIYINRIAVVNTTTTVSRTAAYGTLRYGHNSVLIEMTLKNGSGNNNHTFNIYKIQVGTFQYPIHLINTSDKLILGNNVNYDSVSNTLRCTGIASYQNKAWLKLEFNYDGNKIDQAAKSQVLPANRVDVIQGSVYIKVNGNTSNYLNIYVNDSLQASYNSTSGWTKINLNLYPGKYKLRFEYDKVAASAGDTIHVAGIRIGKHDIMSMSGMTSTITLGIDQPKDPTNRWSEVGGQTLPDGSTGSVIAVDPNLSANRRAWIEYTIDVDRKQDMDYRVIYLSPAGATHRLNPFVCNWYQLHVQQDANTITVPDEHKYKGSTFVTEINMASSYIPTFSGEFMFGIYQTAATCIDKRGGKITYLQWRCNGPHYDLVNVWYKDRDVIGIRQHPYFGTWALCYFKDNIPVTLPSGGTATTSNITITNISKVYSYKVYAYNSSGSIREYYNSEISVNDTNNTITVEITDSRSSSGWVGYCSIVYSID